MESKFKKTAYVPIVALIAALIITISHLVIFKRAFTAGLPGKLIYFIMGTVLLSLISKVRTKIVKVSFANNTITVKQVMGLGQEHRAWLSDISGFYTSAISGRHKKFDYVYIMQGNKKIAKLSNQYHANYPDLLTYARKNFKYLGYYNTNIITEITDLLKQ